MEQSFANKNMISGNNEIIEICMNNVVLKYGSQENPNDQIKTNRNPKNGSE
jgi:phage terminase large subunit-like protein